MSSVRRVKIQKPPKPGDNVTLKQVREAIKMKHTKKQYAWSSKAISEYYYEVDTGKIVGQYSKTSFSDEIYHALVNGDNLGTYISYKHAREAVEKQIAKNDVDEERYRSHPLCGNPETL